MLTFAQVSHPRDTIYGREPQYFYQAWYDSADYFVPVAERECQYSIGYENASVIEVAKYNHTDRPLKVAGIAAAVATQYNTLSHPGRRVFLDGEWRSFPTDTSFANWYEYLRLYQQNDTGYALSGEKTFNAKDTARCMRMFTHLTHPLLPWLRHRCDTLFRTHLRSVL